MTASQQAISRSAILSEVTTSPGIHHLQPVHPTSMNQPSNRSIVTAALTTTLALAAAAHAGSRHFTTTYETTTMPKGAMELETWATWKTDMPSNHDLERFDIRHEFEYGVSDRLQLALYVADWSHEKSSNQPAKTSFEDVAVEAIYNLTDPNTAALGSAVYGEIKVGNGLLELETKILLQKNIGAWIIAYNAGGEIAWEENYEQDEAELAQSIGIAYQFNPSISAGVEIVHEIAVPDVDTIGDSGVFLGPNMAWRYKQFSCTTSGLWQATSLADEPNFQLRTIVSFDF